MTTVPEPQSKTVSPPLRRLSVNLIEKAEQDLAAVMQARGMSRTDVVNRAVQAYAFMMSVEDEGGDVLIRRERPGELLVVRFL
jgi:hypothetical protein